MSSVFQINEMLRRKLRVANNNYMVMSTVALVGWVCFIAAVVIL